MAGATLIRCPHAPLAAAALAVALLGGCDSVGPVESVRIGDRTFHLEVAADPDTRFKGLSGRTHIEPDGGMLFVFDRPQPLNFVMRDCSIPIDVIFLDATGRVTAMHQMQPEEPQGPDESRDAYERRLKRYSSKFAAQFVIELRGGTLPELGIGEGDKVPLRIDALKSIAR